jgi:hypothetical protein
VDGLHEDTLSMVRKSQSPTFGGWIEDDVVLVPQPSHGTDWFETKVGWCRIRIPATRQGVMPNKTPDRGSAIALKRILKLIPPGLITRHARETGVADKSRSFSVVSHLAAMLFAQLSHAMGLNDVCDWLRLKAKALARIGSPHHPKTVSPMPTRTEALILLEF